MIVAPIIVGDEVLGVLDIRSVKNKPFPEHAKTIFELVGRQIGIYYQLATTIKRLQTVQNDQIQTFQDFLHQLRSPLIHAMARTRIASQKMTYNDLQRYNLYAIRGLCSKAIRVSTNIGLFSDLAEKKPVKIQKTKVYLDPLLKLLIQIASDNQVMIDPNRNIHFNVEKTAFEAIRKTQIEFDYNLIEQALNNILDNAGKYSFRETIVRIYGGFTNRGRFHITIMNQGLAIKSEDLKNCVKRNWRGKFASLTTGEGKGIGLWIANHIMKAHKGELMIVPTDADNWTETKLLFPLLKY